MLTDFSTNQGHYNFTPIWQHHRNTQNVIISFQALHTLRENGDVETVLRVKVSKSTFALPSQHSTLTLVGLLNRNPLSKLLIFSISSSFKSKLHTSKFCARRFWLLLLGIT